MWRIKRPGRPDALFTLKTQALEYYLNVWKGPATLLDPEGKVVHERFDPLVKDPKA
jgi:hypothetical protein